MSWKDAIDQIVLEHTAGIVDPLTGEYLGDAHSGAHGILVDAFTASAMQQVSGALNEKNNAEFLDFPVEKAAEVAWRLLKRAD